MRTAGQGAGADSPLPARDGGRDFLDTGPRTIDSVLHVYGIPVAADDIAWIVSALYRVSTPEAVSAALTLEQGSERELYAVALGPTERSAILAVLEDAPETLAELRGVLLRDHTYRLRSLT